MDLVVSIYALTKVFPDDERYGLAAQLRPASVSVPSNIAEGNSRFSVPEYRHAVSIARGSLAEVETQVELARRLGYVTDAHCVQVVQYTTRVGQMLTKLYKSLAP